MFDLFAYWSTVTLISSPSFVFLFVIFLLIADGVSAYATRGRFNIDETKVIQFLNKHERFFGTMAILGFAFTCILFPLAAIENNLTLVEVVSGIATCLTPYIGWVAPSLVLLGTTAHLSRKACDSYYKFKDLLNKVE